MYEIFTMMPLAWIWGLFTWVAWYIGVPLAVGYLGGLLFGQDLEEPEGLEAADSGGRSWNPHTTQQEGLPRSRAYGRNMHHGNIISKWTDVDGNDREILYLIIEHGDGPTEGNVAGEVYLNDQPASNFPDVVVQERVGTMDQAVMTGFEKTKLEYVPNFELKQEDGAHIFTTPNTFFDDIEYTICFPNGLCYYKKSGSRKTFQVHLHVRIREHPAGGWTSIFDADIVSPSGGTTSPFFVKHVVNTLVPDTVERGKQYDLEFTRITADGGERLVSKSNLRSVREVVDVAFTRPGKSLTGIKAIATAKLSGNIDVKIIREDRLINVYNGTSWSVIYSRNRAWIVWDLLTQPVISGSSPPYTIERYEGINPAQLDLNFFYEWAYFCSQQVADGYGSTEDRLACDIILDYQTDVWDLVHKISQIGRAYLWWAGHILTGWIDKEITLPAGLDDLVTMDTVMARSWRNRWVGKDELAGVVEVYYRDKRQGYERTCVPFSKAAAGSYTRVISIEGIGITTYGTAVHVANHALERNRLIKNVNTFSQHKDAFRHKLGDVIRLQHRTPVWGQGYRCIDCPTASTMILDRSIVDVNAGDLLYVRSYDETNEEVKISVYTVVSAAGSTVTIAETWSPTPVRDNIVAIGASGKIVTRRITKIESTVENYFDIEVETYDADLYKADDLDPEAPYQDYIWPGPGGAIEQPATHDDVLDIFTSILPPQPAIDIPQPSNLKWEDDPSEPFDTVTWSKEDGTEDIVFRFRGVDYAITPGSTADEFIYWDPDFSTIFSTTNDVATAVAAGHWLMCRNIDGVAYPVNGLVAANIGILLAGFLRVGTADIEDLAVTTAKIANLNVTTLKVADLAITEGADAYTAGGLTIDGVERTLASVAFTSTSATALISCSAKMRQGQGAGTFTIRVYRDAVKIYEAIGFYLIWDQGTYITFQVPDQPSAGSYTYYFKMVKTAGTNASVGNRSIYIREFKK